MMLADQRAVPSHLVRADTALGVYMHLDCVEVVAALLSSV
jgi:hypothetical protein